MTSFTYLTCIRQLESYYDLTYTIISLIFLSPFLGYSVAALLNNSIHMNFGQRGIAILGPGCRLVTYIIFSLHPPYPVLVVAFAVTGFGNGIITSSKYMYRNF
jgi:fucose permease